ACSLAAERGDLSAGAVVLRDRTTVGRLVDRCGEGRRSDEADESNGGEKLLHGVVLSDSSGFLTEARMTRSSGRPVHPALHAQLRSSSAHGYAPPRHVFAVQRAHHNSVIAPRRMRDNLPISRPTKVIRSTDYPA